MPQSKGRYEMTGKQSMRIFPEGADIVTIKAGADGAPVVEFMFTTKQDPPARRPKPGVFDPLADDDGGEGEEN